MGSRLKYGIIKIDVSFLLAVSCIAIPIWLLLRVILFEGLIHRDKVTGFVVIFLLLVHVGYLIRIVNRLGINRKWRTSIITDSEFQLLGVSIIAATGYRSTRVLDTFWSIIFFTCVVFILSLLVICALKTIRSERQRKATGTIELRVKQWTEQHGFTIFTLILITSILKASVLQAFGRSEVGHRFEKPYYSTELIVRAGAYWDEFPQLWVAKVQVSDDYDWSESEMDRFVNSYKVLSSTFSNRRRYIEIESIERPNGPSTIRLFGSIPLVKDESKCHFRDKTQDDWCVYAFIPIDSTQD